ncbi:MAG: LpxI family protein [Kiritimatiellia bacterium]
MIAGWGIFPRLVVEGARAVGVKRISVLAFKGSTDRATCRAADDCRRIPFGDLALLRESIQGAGCAHAVLAGQINPLALFRARMDRDMRAEIAALKLRNAHTIFLRVVEDIEARDITVLPSSLFMRDHIPPPGCFSARAPNEQEADDLAYGHEIAMGICNLDIGQCVVVKDGVVLAVEGFDGTNATLRRGGRLAPGAVVAKVAKAGHDMRFDIPVVGTKTIALMRRVGLSALGVQAHRALVLDLPRVVEAADRAKIALVAFDTTLPPAPML